MTESEQGLMNIGKHCHYCRQLDFLPFTCSECGDVFCSDHRTPDAHRCSRALVKNNNTSTTTNKSTNSKTQRPTAASLFAEINQPKSYQLKDNQDSNNSSSLNGLLQSNKGKSLGGSAALNKVRSFVTQQRLSLSKKRNTTLLLKSFFKPSPSQRIVEVSKLKQIAKGDPKIPQSERVYAWVIVVPDSETNGEGDFEFGEFFKSKQHLDKNFKKPTYFSRSWPVGRVLDSAAQLYKIKNDNNKVNDKKLRLALFRLARPEELTKSGSEKDKVKEEDAVVPISASGRVNKEIKDGDTLYLIRGAG